jgi:hypothetical protein
VKRDAPSDALFIIAGHNLRYRAIVRLAGSNLGTSDPAVSPPPPKIAGPMLAAG